MKRIPLLVLLAVLALPLAAASARGSGSGSVVVGEVFAAGGNSGAAYANDYVELFNRGAGAVAIDGWTLQYASAVEHLVAGDRAQRHDSGRRPVPRAARLGRNERSRAAGARRNGHVEPRRHRRQGRGRRRCDRALVRILRGQLLGRRPTSRIWSATAAPPTTREAVRRRRRARRRRLHARAAAARTRTTTRPTSRPLRPIRRTPLRRRARARCRRLRTDRAARLESTSTSSRCSRSRSTTRR